MEHQKSKEKKRERDSLATEENKRSRTQSDDVIISGEDDDDMQALLSVGDEAFSELSALLEDADVASPGKVRFAGSPSAIFVPSSAYVTINGNEESCGSSFSDCESTVMATVHFGGVNGGAWGPSADVARGGGVGDEGKGSDGWDCFDDMLARFLGEDIYE